MTQSEHKLPIERLANPFRPGNGVAPPFLAGRDPLLAEFEAYIADRPLHSNWSLTGLRGTGKTVLLAEFAARAERAGWITLAREVGERHRDDDRLADAIEEDADALRRRLSPLAAVGQAIEEGVRKLRPRRLTVGELGYEPAYGNGSNDAADRMRGALSELDGALRDSDRAGALLLYDEAHLVADDRGRERYPLSGLLAALGHVQRREPRIRVVLLLVPTLSLNLKRARTYAERMFRHVVVSSLRDRRRRAGALGVPRPPTAGVHLTFRSPVRSSSAIRTSSSSSAPTSAEASQPPPSRSTPSAQLSGGSSTNSTSPSSRTASRSSPTEQRVLEAMANQVGSVRLIELRRGLSDLVSHDVLLRRLIDRGLVYRAARGTYAFALPLFRDYLRRRAGHATEQTRSVSSCNRPPAG